ncbi:MAG: hypothetical protein WCM93_15515, partial [Bacteroidota bacterium]
MKTIKLNRKNYSLKATSDQSSFKSYVSFQQDFPRVATLILMVVLTSIFAQCKKDDDENATMNTPITEDEYTITQAVSDEAQRNTIAFDGLAFLTGNLGSQSFLP